MRTSSFETCSEGRGEVSQGFDHVGKAEEGENQHYRIRSDPWCLLCQLCLYRCLYSYMLLATAVIDTIDEI